MTGRRSPPGDAVAEERIPADAAVADAPGGAPDDVLDDARLLVEETDVFASLTAPARAFIASQLEPLTLAGGDELSALIDMAEKAGTFRLACRIAQNYRGAHPRRLDGLPLAGRAATLLADRLHERDAARTCLEPALREAVTRLQATLYQ